MNAKANRPVGRFLLRTLALPLSWTLVFCAHAATVWNGPAITYSQPTPDPTQAANQDRITSGVWLTRAASGGLFNAVTETAASADSPADTEWAFGTPTNYASVSYTNWLAWLNGQSPVTLVGQQVLVHLISEDIYIAIQFTLWGSHGVGGFAYQRSTPPPATLSSATLASNQFSFSYTASPGLTYAVQVSANLADWSTITTNLAASNPVLFTNQFIANGSRFYRVVRVPNP
jgi:hypothetical protein